MKNIERVIATLQAKATDRRCFSSVLSLYGARLSNTPLSEYYTEPRAYAQGQKVVQELINPDILFSPFAFACTAESFGSEVRYFAENPPILKRPALSSINEIGKLKLPDPKKDKRLLFLQQTIKLMVEQTSAETPIAGVMLSPVDLPSIFLGVEGWLDTVIFHPQEAQKILQSLQPFFVELANLLFESGAAFAAMPCVFLATAVLPREIIQSIMIPAVQNALCAIKGPVVLHHAGCPLSASADLVATLPNLCGIVPDAKDDLLNIRKLVGPNLTIIGGVDGPKFASETRTDILESAKQILHTLKEDPRFILCTTGPDIPWDTPLENILALRDAVESAAPGGI